MFQSFMAHSSRNFPLQPSLLASTSSPTDNGRASSLRSRSLSSWCFPYRPRPVATQAIVHRSPTIQPLSARSQPLSLSDEPPCHSLNPRNSSPRGLLPLLRSLINLLYTASRPNPVAGGYLVSPADDIICRERLRIAASTTAAGTPNNFLAFESPMRPRHHDSARDHTTR
jgi:hypothetical protein